MTKKKNIKKKLDEIQAGVSPKHLPFIKYRESDLRNSHSDNVTLQECVMYRHSHQYYVMQPAYCPHEILGAYVHTCLLTNQFCQ